MALKDNVFPQDGDPNDGARFAQIVAQQNTNNFVQDGLTVSYDSANEEITISDGVCFTTTDQDKSVTDGKTIQDVGYAVQVAERTIAADTNNQTNYVYVEPDLSKSDVVDVYVRQPTNPGPDTALLIARVERDTDTVIEENRHPAGRFSTLVSDVQLTNSIDVSERLKNATYATQADLPSSSVDVGEVAYVNDSDELVVYDGTWRSIEADYTLPQLSAIDASTSDTTVRALSHIFDESGWGDPYYTDGPSVSGQNLGPFSAATVAPNGQVIFVPRDETNVGIFDPTDNSFTDGAGTNTPSGAFRSATLVPDGRIIFAPQEADNIGIYNPTTDTYNDGPKHNEGATAFSGSALAPDGRVIFSPLQSSNVGIFDPSTDSYIQGPTHGETTPAFDGATLAPNGDIIFTPESGNVGIFDPSTDSYTSGDSSGGDYSGAVLAPDGRIIFVPSENPSVGIYDPETGTHTDGPTHGETTPAFGGATLAPDGRIIFAPNNATSVGIFDPTTDTYTSGPSSTIGFGGAALTHDGRVVFAPTFASNVGIFDPHADLEQPKRNTTHPLIQT